ncbi:MAG: S1C family serine protease [Nitrospiraceae bacterium]
MNKTRHRPEPSLGLALTILLAACASDGLTPMVQAKESVPINNVRIYKKVAPATVFIKSAFASENPMGGTNSNIGSGVILDQEGLILTNAHVVDNATKIFVALHSGAQLVADLVGTDPLTDLALLRVHLPKTHQATAQLGDSDRVEIGQDVVAIGHPFGFGYALTTGVVSGFGSTPEPRIAFREPIIQTSAAINPGNSGGPLVDIEGRVIGINTAVLAGGQNIGFAIPINTAKTVVAELQTHGHVIRPWFGIAGKLVPNEMISLFALPLSKGLLVMHIDEGSPAQRAGLRAGTLNVTIEGDSWLLGGDILVEVNGLALTTEEQYVTIFKTLQVGQKIDVRILRDGIGHYLTLTLDELPLPQVTGGQPKSRAPAVAGTYEWRSSHASMRENGLHM